MTLKTTNTSTGAAGIFGWSSSPFSNATRGVYGRADGPNSYGVYASNTGGYGNGAAIRAVATYNDGVHASGSTNGVYGTGTMGVRGESPLGQGVWGICSNGWALYGTGNGAVTGTFFKASGTFKIDHPQAPATKYLQHSFVESPDMKNVYDGVATLDAQGEATVQLPGYFEVLNRDLRYQLTPLGASSPLYIKSKVAKGRFRIAGGKPGQEVCWQLTGIRQDPWAMAHPVVVEEGKKGKERGTYLHPELYGQPESKGVDYEARRKAGNSLQQAGDGGPRQP